MPRTATLSPAALALARATVDLTGTDTAPDIPAIRNAWAALKSARGQPVNVCRLPPAHLITPTAQERPAPVESIAQAVERALPATLGAIRSRGLIPLSDFDGAA